MADQQMDRPPTFLPVPGEPLIQWKMWKKMFDSYLIAIGGSGFGVLRKQHILLNSLGVEGRRIYKSLPDIHMPVGAGDPVLDCFAVTERKLEAQFGQRPNVVMERHRFFVRKQMEGENVLNFVSNLRTLAQTCQFDHLEDGLIRDQMVRCCLDKKLREKLLAIEDITLDRTIKLMRAAEMSSKQLHELEKGTQKLDIAAVSKTASIPKPFAKKQSPSDKRFGFGVATKKPLSCFRCGALDHLANYGRCPGRTAQCIKCKRYGHTSKVCKEGAKVNVVDALTEVHQETDSEADSVPVHMLQVKSTQRKRGPWTVVKVDDCYLDMMVDTGSAFTVLSRHVYENVLNKKESDLEQTQLVPRVYGEIPLQFVGKWKAELSWKDNMVAADVYVVDKGDTLLGWDQIVDLGITVQPSMDPPIQPSMSPPICQVTAQQIELRKICEDFPSAFDSKVGLVKGYMCKIKLREGSMPVAHKLRPVKRQLLKPLKEELDKLLKENIIEEVHGTDWVSPLAIATKANGEMRLCVNLKKLNKSILVDKYPLPRINEMLMSVKESKVFSSLDLRSAYHQVALESSSRPLTSFITPFGTYKFNRMPFGLASAASVFQRLMDKLFGGNPNIFCFQDDLLLFSENMHEHKILLRNVLKKIEEVGMTLKMEKCKFGCASVDYLGHTLTSQGLLPKRKHVESVENFAIPKNKDDVRSFLGLIEYYAKFIKNLSSRTESLRSIFKKNVLFKWDEMCEAEFEELKKEVTSANVLSPFVDGLETFLITDASKKGLGAVLMQKCNGRERTVAFASRALKGAECNYSAIEREALAIFWAVKYFNVFLWGVPFYVKTDHKPLLAIFNDKNIEDVTPRISKWMLYLHGYNFYVTYLRGECNAVADCLSRVESNIVVCDENVEQEKEEWEPVFCLKNVCLSKEEWWSAIVNDQEYQSLKTLIVDGWPCNKDMVIDSCKKFWEVRDQLYILDDKVFRDMRIVPPIELRERLIVLAHEGHLGRYLTKKRLREVYWWPVMDGMVEVYVRDCMLCAQSDKAHKHVPEVVESIPIPEKPWIKLAIDIMGPVQGLGSTKYLIVIIDYMSKWPVIVEAQNVNTATVIKALKELFNIEGVPEEIVSDNGVQFVSTEMEEFLKGNGIRHRCTALYSPRQNGLVERMNRTIKGALQMSTLQEKNWRVVLSEMLWAYRTTPRGEDNKSPFQVMRGREPGHKLCPAWLKNGCESLEACEKNKNLKSGDWVRIKCKEHKGKLGQKWGVPQKVKKVYKNVIELENGKKWSFSDVTKCYPVELKGQEEVEETDWDVEEMLDQQNDVRQDGERQNLVIPEGRARRQVTLPRRLQDYVLT